MITTNFTSPRDSISDTNVLLHDDGITMIATRRLGLGLDLDRVITICDGTTGDFATKVNKLGLLSDEMFATFSRLQLDELVTTN